MVLQTFDERCSHTHSAIFTGVIISLMACHQQGKIMT
jgi:hypothetical protein